MQWPELSQENQSGGWLYSVTMDID